MKSIRHRLFLVACIVAGIIILLWWKGCLCNSQTTNTELKVYKDSINKLNRNLATVDKELGTQLNKFSGLVLFYSNRSDSFENLRNVDLRLIAASKTKAIPLIGFVKHDTLSTKECDSLADEFQNYIWLTQSEKDKCDSIIASKDFQIAALDSSLENSLRAYLTCKDYFRAATELFGITYQAYQKVKPRFVVSLIAAGQYDEATKKISVGGGLNFKNKKGYSLGTLVLLGVSGDRNYQLQFGVPISFRKK